MFFKIAWQSLRERRGSVILSLGALVLSMFVLFGVESLRLAIKSGFTRTVSGVDLIVGARAGDMNLLLYAVFRLGNATQNVRWSSYQTIVAAPEVKWSIPISLGDSHKGYKVLGTTADYFTHFRFGENQTLRFSQGTEFGDTNQVVLGAEVARQLDYTLGSSLILAHGTGSASLTLHAQHPFKVVGILAATGTPVDQTLHVSLAAIDAIHGNESGATQGPKSITAFLIGLKSRTKVFQMQRRIQQFTDEPLMAILPGVALMQFWSSMKLMENSLRLIGGMVVMAALLGMAAMLLASLRERQREINLLRILGASPLFISCLVQLEIFWLITMSLILGWGLLLLTFLGGQTFFAAELGLHLSFRTMMNVDWVLILWIYIGGFVVGVFPALGVYFRSNQINSGI
jgi:putative ABC transport system permease protein